MHSDDPLYPGGQMHISWSAITFPGQQSHFMVSNHISWSAIIFPGQQSHSSLIPWRPLYNVFQCQPIQFILPSTCFFFHLSIHCPPHAPHSTSHANCFHHLLTVFLADTSVPAFPTLCRPTGTQALSHSLIGRLSVS